MTAKKTVEKPATVAVEYVGPNRGIIERVIKNYRWDVGNKYVANVPQDFADELIVFSEFKIKENE